MKKQIFLKNLNKKRIITLVEPSIEMKLAYLTKAENCLKSAKLLFKNELYENSTSESYYCMYNSILSLLFSVGIKSQNHSASILLFEKLFDYKNLSKIILLAKEERIDKQYYVDTKKTKETSKKSCQEILLNAENFLTQIRMLLNEINNQKIESIRISFTNLIK